MIRHSTEFQQSVSGMFPSSWLQGRLQYRPRFRARNAAAFRALHLEKTMIMLARQDVDAACGRQSTGWAKCCLRVRVIVPPS